MDKKFSILMLTSLAIVMAGCGKKDKIETVEETAVIVEETAVDVEKTTTSSAIPLPALPEPEADVVLAVIDGKNIMSADALKAMGPQLQYMKAQMDPAKFAEVKQNIYDNYVAQTIAKKLLLAQAKLEGIVVTPEKVTATIDEIKASVPAGQDFDATMAQAGMTEEKLRAEIGDSLVIEQLVGPMMTNDFELTEEQYTSFVEQNKDKLALPSSVQASHILVTVDKDDTPEVKTEKRAKIEALKKQIDNGTDFAKLAEENSDCPSGKRAGGDLGKFSKGQMVPEFETVAYELKDGEVSDIVETQFGYHIIKKTATFDAGLPPKIEIEKMAKKQITMEKFKKYVDELKAKSNIEYVNAKPLAEQK